MTFSDLELLVTLTESGKLQTALALEKFCKENDITTFLPSWLPRNVTWNRLHTEFHAVWGQYVFEIANTDAAGVPTNLEQEPWVVLAAKHSDNPTVQNALQAYLNNQTN